MEMSLQLTLGGAGPESIHTSGEDRTRVWGAFLCMVPASRGRILAMVSAAHTMARAPTAPLPGGLEQFLTAPSVVNLGTVSDTEDFSRQKPSGPETQRWWKLNMCAQKWEVLWVGLWGARLPEPIRFRLPKCRLRELSQVWTIDWDPRPLCVLKVGVGCETIVIKVTGMQGGGMGNTMGGLRDKLGPWSPQRFSSGWASGQVGARSVHWLSVQ